MSQILRVRLYYLFKINNIIICVNFSNPSVKVLMTTGCSKYYSNGLDLKRLAAMTSKEFVEFTKNTQRLHQRLLVFSRPTIAVVNGV